MSFSHSNTSAEAILAKFRLARWPSEKLAIVEPLLGLLQLHNLVIGNATSYSHTYPFYVGEDGCSLVISERPTFQLPKDLNAIDIYVFTDMAVSAVDIVINGSAIIRLTKSGSALRLTFPTSRDLNMTINDEDGIRIRKPTRDEIERNIAADDARRKRDQD